MCWQVDSFLHIIEVAGGAEVEEYFPNSRFERLQIHCAAAGYHLNVARAAKDLSAKTAALNRATGHLNKAITIDYNEQLPILGLGQVALAKVAVLQNAITNLRTYCETSHSLCYGMHVQIFVPVKPLLLLLPIVTVFSSVKPSDNRT